MNKNLKNKVALIIVVLVVCIYGIIGIPSGFSGKALMDAVGQRIHLGLDLKGGAHLILQVQVKEAVSADTDNTIAGIQQDLRTANLTVGQVVKPDPLKPDGSGRPEVISVEGITPASSSAVRTLLEGPKYANQYDVSDGPNSSLLLTMKPLVLTDLEKTTVDQAIEAIRDRVDALGVSEPQIQQYGLGDNQILVDLPGVENESQIEAIIQGTNRLEIHAVVGGPYKDEQEAAASLGGAIPPDDEVKTFYGVTSTESSEGGAVYVLQRASIVAGTDFRSADPGTDQNGRRNVQFTLTNEAGDKFHDYTSANVGKSMAVVLNNQVREVATIQSAISDRGEITGSFSPEEVSALSKLLRTGALPASLTQLEKRFVGASLGADSIRQGVTAAVVGVLVVMAFMLIYYKGSGINADLALFLNLLILLGFMGFSKSTLTLPGIAGVILTIGMGVDSNVLIFERIREEIRAGKAASAAVDQGFAHAWVTIIDTHVTTIVSAAILFLFGTGPVRGFATTLTFGLAANLFTAVYVSRVIFDAHLNKLKTGEMVSI
jgi:preprotein translocase subunit SecD